LHGTMSYPAKVSISPIGIIMSLEHAAHSVEDRLVARQSDLQQYRKNHDELQSHVGKPFEHEDRYRELQGRQAELVAALDITKSQASSALSAEVVEVEAESNKQTIAPTVRMAV